ncbi:kinase-like protein [Trametopsis cervina]|nr:kinase-like protein [Trametopsis cervina]
MSITDSIRVPRQVEWVSTLTSVEPRWTVEPSIPVLEQLVRQRLALPTGSSCHVAFFAEGGFNKLYTVEANGHTHLIRVALPVEPRLKTLSEVATISFVRQYATDLVPQVVAYGADAASPDVSFPFDWIIMEKLPGKPLEERWDEMSYQAKETIVSVVVNVLAKLYAHPLSGIGNIYADANNEAPSRDVTEVGRIVSMAFFWHKHYDYDVERGPFRCSHDWLAARLAFVLHDAKETLSTSTDEDEVEEAEKSQELAIRLMTLLPTFFPPATDTPERTVIHHDDISFHNLLVDDTSKLTGILDWECVSALPLWKACQLPTFLNSRHRAERPDPATYSTEEDGSPSEMYTEHLREWEVTKLRAFFLAEMERVEPAWIRQHRIGQKLADFELAVSYCDDEFARWTVKRWVDGVEENSGAEYLSLQDQLLG